MRGVHALSLFVGACVHAWPSPEYHESEQRWIVTLSTTLVQRGEPPPTTQSAESWTVFVQLLVFVWVTGCLSAPTIFHGMPPGTHHTHEI